MIVYQPGRKIVYPVSEIARCSIVTHMNTRSADRRHGYVDPRVIHVGQGGFLRPRRWSDTADRIVRVVRGLPEEVGKDVVVNVDGKRHRISHIVVLIISA